MNAKHYQRFTLLLVTILLQAQDDEFRENLPTWLSLYTMLGQQIATLPSVEIVRAGTTTYKLTLNGMTSSNYLLVIEQGKHKAATNATVVGNSRGIHHPPTEVHSLPNRLQFFLCRRSSFHTVVSC